MKTRNITFLIILLVVIDQAIKLIIYHFFMDINYKIIPEVLDFQPMFNTKNSFVNDLAYKKIGIDLGLIFHVILFALIWIFLFLFYRFFKGVAPKNKMLDVSFSFFTAGVICAYLGILIWEKGVLDFLYFKLLVHVVFDLKDIYINCFLLLLVISTMKIEKEHQISLKNMGDYLKDLFK